MYGGSLKLLKRVTTFSPTKIYLKIQTFPDVSPSRQANTYRRFEVLQCLNVQDEVSEIFGLSSSRIWITWPWRRAHYDPTQCGYLLNNVGVKYQKTNLQQHS